MQPVGRIHKWRRALVLVALMTLGGLSTGCRSLHGVDVDEEFAGLRAVTSETENIRLLVVHGMGGFSPGDPEHLVEGLARGLALDREGEVRHLSFDVGRRDFGRIATHRFVGPSSRRLDATAYYWTGVTTIPEDLYLAYDKSEDNRRLRVDVNHDLKRGFIDHNLPDLSLYWGRHGASIRQGLRCALRHLVADGDGPIVIVTFSLAARIVMDTLHDLTTSSDSEDRELAHRVFDRFRGMYMLSNQLALLELIDYDYQRSFDRSGGDDAAPRIVASPALATFDRELRRREKSSGSRARVVAVSDPNDLFSFAVPHWMKEIFPGRFVNVLMNIAETAYFIPFVGEIVRPDRAHRGYGKSPDVLSLLLDGGAPGMHLEDALGDARGASLRRRRRR